MPVLVEDFQPLSRCFAWTRCYRLQTGATTWSKLSIKNDTHHFISSFKQVSVIPSHPVPSPYCYSSHTQSVRSAMSHTSRSFLWYPHTHTYNYDYDDNDDDVRLRIADKCEVKRSPSSAMQHQHRIFSLLYAALANCFVNLVQGSQTFFIQPNQSSFCQ